MQNEAQIYHPARDQKAIRVLKAVLRWGGLIVLMGLAVLVVAIAYLSHVGEPSSTSSMKFEGFIELPKDRIVNIFDYMALSDRTIFVGNMLSGSVVKVQLINKEGGRSPPSQSSEAPVMLMASRSFRTKTKHLSLVAARTSSMYFNPAHSTCWDKSRSPTTRTQSFTILRAA